MKTIYDYIGIAYFAEFLLAVILMINGSKFLFVLGKDTHADFSL